MEYRPGMFRSYRPLFWVLLATAAFYLYAFMTWPLVMTAIFAAIAGVLMSIGVGSWIRSRVERNRDEWEFAEMIRREKADEELRSINDRGDRDAVDGGPEAQGHVDGGGYEDELTAQIELSKIIGEQGGRTADPEVEGVE